MKRLQLFLAILILVLAPTSAFAYIGPGAGLGAVATFIAIILGFLLLVVGFLWYPLKRILNKRKKKTSKNQEDPAKVDDQ